MNEKLKEEFHDKYFIDNLREFMGPYMGLDEKIYKKEKPIRYIDNANSSKEKKAKEEALELLEALKEINYDNNLAQDIITHLTKIINNNL